MILICPEEAGRPLPPRLTAVLEDALSGENPRIIRRAEEMGALAGERLLFAISLGEDGVNLEYCRMLSRIRREPGLLPGCTGALIVDGEREIYTKAIARELVFAANQAGCAFPGRPLVEGTGSLRNYRVQARLGQTDLEDAYRLAARDLVRRLRDDTPPLAPDPKLLVLHASSFRTSNTWNFWCMVKEDLAGLSIREISLRNGEISDCVGCPYTMCMHYSEEGKCYYGGPMVELVTPAIQECSALLLLCPNYNDALGANLAAFINRLTGIYRKTPFDDKYLFAVVVSGYSGGDLVASQLVSGLNMNKAFRLPPEFAVLEAANEPGSIFAVEGIHDRAAAFARRIRTTLLPVDPTSP